MVPGLTSIGFFDFDTFTRRTGSTKWASIRSTVKE